MLFPVSPDAHYSFLAFTGGWRVFDAARQRWAIEWFTIAGVEVFSSSQAAAATGWSFYRRHRLLSGLSSSSQIAAAAGRGLRRRKSLLPLFGALSSYAAAAE